MINTKSIFIIAEAGVNHNGSIKTAYELIDAAVDAGADAVKFQMWKTENVVTKNSKKALYQLQGADDSETQFEMLQRLELSPNDFLKLKYYCDGKKINFLATADEIESAAFLNSIQNMFKVGSAELTDLPYLRELAKFKKPILLSTGMGSLSEIDIALKEIIKHGVDKDDVVVLQCNTAYPTPLEDANVLAMVTIGDTLNVNVGYSDHTLGIETSIVAASLGATVIEKHFTLDKNMKGPDHKISLEPDELKSMIKAIRNVKLVLGSGKKEMSQSEQKNMPLVRKSIVAKKIIFKGEIFDENNITVKRPAGGIAPSLWDTVIGEKAIRDFNEDEVIEL